MAATDDDQLPQSGWTFFSNHAHVLFSLVQHPDRRLREVADEVGITERAVQRIVADLVEAGFVIRNRIGRRNEYEFVLDQPLRHDLEAHCTVRQIMAVLVKSD